MEHGAHSSVVVEKLRQWETAGGTVRIVARSDTEADIELCACTGERMERFSSTDPAVFDYFNPSRAPER